MRRRPAGPNTEWVEVSTFDSEEGVEYTLRLDWWGRVTLRAGEVGPLTSVMPRGFPYDYLKRRAEAAWTRYYYKEHLP